MVLPWKPPRKAMMPWRPVVLRASLTAPSTASAPEFIVMNDSMPSGVTSRKFSANRISDSERGVVAIVGPCKGTIEPYVPHLIRNTRQLKELLTEGPADEAARLAFNPSRDPGEEVRGAESVLILRANNAQQGTILMQNASTVVLHTMLSKWWGIQASLVGLEREAGTLGGLGQKITISYPRACMDVKKAGKRHRQPRASVERFGGTLVGIEGYRQNEITAQ